ncbi:iron-sulfur cluster co-chaperone protein HscB [Tropilaelaps mercedesae]|uniref:Iron-sulfur cluster co-chaperone protein HscB n=1 Tax=Tropilaelaps mercedesae TaxID=418985 RepID=A0A1V9X959_9ACAR|nr:iron-sulfur cluster co-chaperone protein HscB [Tropilaelaps mercedesae]
MNGVALEEVKLPEEFLLEMMDLNEQVDEANDKARKKLLRNITNLQEAAMVELQENFVKKNSTEASKILAKIKYLDNLVNRLKQIEKHESVKE